MQKFICGCTQTWMHDSDDIGKNHDFWKQAPELGCALQLERANCVVNRVFISVPHSEQLENWGWQYMHGSFSPKQFPWNLALLTNSEIMMNMHFLIGHRDLDCTTIWKNMTCRTPRPSSNWTSFVWMPSHSLNLPGNLFLGSMPPMQLTS